MILSKQAEESSEMREIDESQADVLVDDYKDMEIELMVGTRENRLAWNKYGFDNITGFNEYD